MMDLMPHQHEGVAFLLGRAGALLAFEQGLGKTLVAIEAFRKLKSAGDLRRLLVVCPNSLKRNWVAEIEKFGGGLTTEIVEGPPRHRRAAFASTKADVVITSYETARAEVTALLSLVQRAPTALTLDESHATKNHASLTSTAMRHVAPLARYRWLLSGTPVTNSPEDLYTQIEIVAPGQQPLGARDAFLADALDDPTSPRIQARLSPFVLRRTKAQCLDLPDKLFVDVRVELPAWQRKLYDDVRSAMISSVRAMDETAYKSFASTALTQLTRLCQIASNPALVVDDCTETPAKFEEIDRLVEEILAEPERKLIIWCSYVETIRTLVARYQHWGATAIYGAVPVDERQDVAAALQSDASVRILVANPAAAGTGFTLTKATFSIYESLSWRYDFYAQSQDRNHRIGQTEPVTYLRLIAVDTIDEAIIEALERKSALAGGLLGDSGNESRISEFTAAEMCSLLLHNRLPLARG